MPRLVNRLFLSAYTACALFACVEFVPRVVLAQATGPLTPNQEKATMHLADRLLQVELVTSEPYLTSPVDVCWDANSRMYVAEVIDYPAARTPGHIVRFEDVNGDGAYDQFTVFADNLNLPASLIPYRDGVLVLTSRDIVYLKDADDNGMSESREVILTGLRGGHPLLRPGSLNWGVDLWIYASHGGEGKVRRPQDPQANAVSVDGHDFRFRPDGSRVEVLTGASPVGLALDAHGTRFLASGEAPVREVVLEESYLRRHGALPLASTIANTLDKADSDRLFVDPRREGTENSGTDFYFRATRAPHIFRGNDLPLRYLNNLFVCEPRLNLVHRVALEPDGAIQTARRRDVQSEFLTAGDPWFRPVAVETGPDGGLYVVDFYRAGYEYPENAVARMSSNSSVGRGVDRGRLWRIAPAPNRAAGSGGAARRNPSPQLQNVTNAALVPLLGHDNGWWRETASRLLVERNAQDVVGALKDIFQQPRNAKARLHALWTLEALGALDEATLVAALADVFPGLRENALLLAEPRMANSSAIRAAVLGCVSDNNPRVRLRLAATLGRATGDDVTAALVEIASRNVDDPWIRRTVLASAGRDPTGFLERLLDEDSAWLSAPSVEQMQLLREAAEVVGARNQDAELTRIIKRAAPAGENPVLRGERALVLGLVEGMARAGRAMAGARSELERLGAERTQLDQLFDAAGETASSASADLDLRLAAIRFMVADDPQQAGPVLLALAIAPQPPAVTNASIQALVELNDAAQSEALIAQWPTLDPTARRTAVAALLRWPGSRELLISALESEQIPAADLEPVAVEALGHLPDDRERQRVAAVTASRAAVDHDADVASFTQELRAIMAAPPEVNPEDSAAVEAALAAGAERYSRHCLACHRVGRDGVLVGPDLAGSLARGPEAVLRDVLEPQLAVPPSQTVSIVVLKSGELLYGTVRLDTPTSMTIQGSDGQNVILPREQVAAVHATELSLMPPGIVRTLTPMEFYELGTFLSTMSSEALPAESRTVEEGR